MHSVYLQPAVVCYDAVVSMETAQVALNPIKHFKRNQSQLNADAFCEKSFTRGLF